MTEVDPNSTLADLSRGIYRSALCLVMGVWLVSGLGLHLILAGFQIQLLGWSLLIWLASGMVAALALTPGCLWPQRREAQWQGGDLLLGITASMGIRFAGTVALFGLCRYHDGLSAEATAALVCGWYLFLTSIEVAGLARAMSAATGLSAVAAGSSPTSVTE